MSFLLKFIFVSILLLLLIYYLNRPIKTTEGYIFKARIYNLLLFKNKELQLYKQALQKEELNEDTEKDINYLIGLWYENRKEYVKATQYFDKSFKYYSKPFKYQPEFKKVIKAYYKAQKFREGNDILQQFLKLQEFDKRFGRLKKFSGNFGDI